MNKVSLASVVICIAFSCALWGQTAPKTTQATTPAQAKKKVAPRKVPDCEIRGPRNKVPAGRLVKLRVIHPKPEGTTFTYEWSISAGESRGNTTPILTVITNDVPPSDYITATVVIRADTDAPYGPDRHKTCSYSFQIAKPGKSAPKPKPPAAKP